MTRPMAHRRCLSDAVQVPEEFARLGYSGLFQVESAMVGTSDEIAAFEATLPCLSRTAGWMVLRLNRRPDGVTATLVRQDMLAVEVVTGRPR